MNEQENIKIVRQAYQNFKTGDIPSLLGLISEDADWELPQIENVPFSGRRKGLTEVTEFFQILAEDQESVSFNPQEFIAQGDKVAVLGNYLWRVKENGREYGGDWVHVFTVRGGKIAGFKEYMNTAAAATAHQKAASA